MMTFCYHESPIGRLLLARDEEGLRHLHLDEADPWEVRGDWREDPGPFDGVRRQLDEYFAGRRQRFDARLAPRGTEFQRAVWTTLQAIPFGRTECYAELAARLGRPRAVRAVGAANGANPIAILIPCHRVVGRDGTLTGYAGGLERKEVLLRLEGWQPGRRHPRQ
jgi:methylated-DNA-[protein]-cysteine S-methyltransferase